MIFVSAALHGGSPGYVFYGIGAGLAGMGLYLALRAVKQLRNIRVFVAIILSVLALVASLFALSATIRYQMDYARSSVGWKAEDAVWKQARSYHDQNGAYPSLSELKTLLRTNGYGDITVAEYSTNPTADILYEKCQTDGMITWTWDASYDDYLWMKIGDTTGCA